jgi:predicted RNase H-like nuclease (RuvC/YqgF family)
VASKPKFLTREQLEGRKEKAVRFTRDVVGDPDRADEIAEESLEDYAARRNILLTNPHRRIAMPRKTIDDYRAENRELKQQVSELEDQNDELQDRRDDVVSAATGDEEDENDDTDDMDDDNSDDDPAQ